MAKRLPIDVLGVTNGVPTVSSRDIAAQFDKRHDNIIRDISELEISSELRGSWFCNELELNAELRSTWFCNDIEELELPSDLRSAQI